MSDITSFSVAMSVYGRDHADWFDTALDSIVHQSVHPSEIILVVDGPVPQDIHAVVERYRTLCTQQGIDLVVIPLSENQGFGNALRTAVEHCHNELIARMDSDDISLPNRFERQLTFFAQRPDISIVGGNISEFVDDTTNVIGQRRCPQDDTDIKQYMRRRCAMNHVTVMFRKSEVLRAGNYQDWFYNEDYYLWIRMMQAGCSFANLNETLVNVRMNPDSYARRGGIRYYRSERDLQRYMHHVGIIGFGTMASNIALRFIIQRLMPNWMRALVFRKVFRSEQ